MEFLIETIKNGLLMNKKIMDLCFILLPATNLSIIGNFISMETKMRFEFPKIYLQRVSGVQPVLKMIYLQIIFSFRKNIVLLKSALSLF